MRTITWTTLDWKWLRPSTSKSNSSKKNSTNNWKPAEMSIPKKCSKTQLATTTSHCRRKKSNASSQNLSPTFKPITSLKLMMSSAYTMIQLQRKNRKLLNYSRIRANASFTMKKLLNKSIWMPNRKWKISRRRTNRIWLKSRKWAWRAKLSYSWLKISSQMLSLRFNSWQGKSKTKRCNCRHKM